MNIVFIATEIAPSKNGAFTGGLVNNVIRLSKGLTEKGHRVHIVTTDVNNNLGAVEKEYEWATIYPVVTGGKYASLRSNLSFLLKVIPTLKKINKRCAIDSIHVHSAYSVFGIVASLTTIFTNKPVIYTQYSPVHTKPLNDRKGIYQFLSSAGFIKLFLYNVESISCISENIKESLIKAGIERNITIIPPIIDTAVFNSKLDGMKKRHELGIPEDSKVVLYCGSWAKWKGVDLLIQAFSEAKIDNPNLFLITAWGEPYDWYDERKSELSKMIDSLGLKDNVIELGVVNDIHMVMAASDIFVAPFLNIDGVADPPLSILEAMACGKTVIATKIASIPFVIENEVSGFLVNPNDTGELYHVLFNVLNNHEIRIKVGRNAENYVHNYYGTSAVTQKLMQAYQDI